jgi:transcriptional regulator with XRE-family HTH domain
MTQREVAAACGVRFQQIQKYECGVNRMSAAMIWRLANLLQAPVGYFFAPVDALLDSPAAANEQISDTAAQAGRAGEVGRRGLP